MAHDENDVASQHETGATSSAARQAARLFERIIAWFQRFSIRWEIHADLTRFCLIVLTVLLAIDVVSVVADAAVTLLREWDADSAPSWFNALRVDAEFSFWSIIGYAKLLCGAALLVELYGRTRLLSYAMLAAIFFYLAADDALMIHERFGDFLAANVNLSGFGTISPDHIGELIFFAAIGPMVIGGLLLAIMLSPKLHRVNIWIVTTMVLGIGFFAVGIDFIDQIVAHFSRTGSKLMSLLDDGGENVVVSFTIVFLIMIRTRVRAIETAQPDRNLG